MAMSGPVFELPGKVDHYLGILSKVYMMEGKKLKLSIIVNAQINVIEGTFHDNWNGGIDGHSLILTIPQDLFLSILDDRNKLEDEICKDINKLHAPESEHIADVTFEMLPQAETDWRVESGALAVRRRVIPLAESKKIWGDSGFRVFLSHKTEVKKETAKLKAGLRLFGISAFVAHEDIHPTKKWQDEIESALDSMDAFVALLTKDFHESKWTDQEVGYAVAKGVPIIAVRLGLDPYGFIGKFQGLSCGWDEAPFQITSLLIQQPKMVDAYIKAIFACNSFDNGNTLAGLLPLIESLTMEQADEMASHYGKNQDLYGSWGFNGAKPSLYGLGLAHHLTRITCKKYAETDLWTIERAK